MCGVFQLFQECLSWSISKNYFNRPIWRRAYPRQKAIPSFFFSFFLRHEPTPMAHLGRGTMQTRGRGTGNRGTRTECPRRSCRGNLCRGLWCMRATRRTVCPPRRRGYPMSDERRVEGLRGGRLIIRVLSFSLTLLQSDSFS